MYRSNRDRIEDFNVGDHVSYPLDNARFTIVSKVSEEMAKGMATLAGYGDKHQFYNKIGVVIGKADDYWWNIALIYQHDFDFFIVVGEEV